MMGKFAERRVMDGERESEKGVGGGDGGGGGCTIYDKCNILKLI